MALDNRFGDKYRGEAMVELLSLKQTDSVASYHDGFEALLGKVNNLESFALSLFLNGLKPAIQRAVKLFMPETLAHALILARFQESMINDCAQESLQPVEEATFKRLSSLPASLPMDFYLKKSNDGENNPAPVQDLCSSQGLDSRKDSVNSAGKALELFLKIGLDGRTVRNTINNNKVTTNLTAVIHEADLTDGCCRTIGNLLYTVATKYPANALVHRPILLEYVVSSKIKTPAQLEAAFSFLSNVASENFKMNDFEEACGVGVEVSVEEITRAVNEIFEENKAVILEQCYRTNVGELLGSVRKKHPWADPKIAKKLVEVFDPYRFRLLVMERMRYTSLVMEKGGQFLHCVWDDRRGFFGFARQKRVCIFRHDGSVLSGGGSVPAIKATPGTWIEMVNTIQKGSLSTRLGIPMIYGIDAVHDHNNVYKATIFPHNVGLEVTRDPQLIRKIGDATALEVRATGIPYVFAPCIADCRDPKWGRCYESYSEYHTIVQLMTEIIPGLQGDLPANSKKGVPFVAGKKKVAACAKHYLGDRGTTRGINENDTMISLNGLLSIHMPAYLKSISKGVATIMVSCSIWNGKKMHANRDLVTGFLKNKLKFRGFVISDWIGIDKITSPPHANYSYSVEAGIGASIDMIMVSNFTEFIDDLTYQVKHDMIPMSRINGDVKRILRVEFVMGLFENPMADYSLVNQLGSQEHRELAKEAVELLKGLNYCDAKICEEILQKGNHYAVLLELYRGSSMHRETLTLLQQLIDESKASQSQAEFIQKFSPEGRYLELMLAMDENGISGNLQNEIVQIYLSEVLEWHSELSAQQIWDEKAYSPTRKKLLSALESISGYSSEALLKRLPSDALFEERAILLGKMNQHELALSLYVHKLHVPELALAYCDRAYESVAHQPPVKSSGNIYITLLQIYLNPQKTTKNFEKRITNLVSFPNASIPNISSTPSFKTRGGRKKIASIEGAEDMRIGPSNTDSSRSDGDAEESSEKGGSSIMLDQVLDLLSQRWEKNILVYILDPYKFRLLLMGRMNCNVDTSFTMILVRWSNSFEDDATWEYLLICSNSVQHLNLEDKVHFMREDLIHVKGRNS